MDTKAVEKRRAGFRQLVRAQEGVFTVVQAREAGFSEDAIRRRVRSREWARLGHGVMELGTRVRTPRSRVFAAVLSLPTGAVLVGATAAWWWRMTDAVPAVLDVAVPRDTRPGPRRGVRTHRRDVADADRLVVDGVPVTTRALTVLDVAADQGAVEGARLMDRVLQRDAVGLDDLRAAHLARAGRPGTELLRRLLWLAGGGARSEAERLAHDGLRAAGILGWSADVPLVLPGFGRVVLDIAFDGVRVVVEVDGWAYHRDRRAFVHDAARQNALAAAGWVVLRTTWHELTTEPARLVVALRAVLARRSDSGA